MRRGIQRPYGLFGAQERGRLFLGAGVPVYEGMIVGASPKAEDIVVNVCKKEAHHQYARRLGRSPQADAAEHSQSGAGAGIHHRRRTVEVTPKSIRLRKMILSKEQRLKKASRANA